MNYKLQRIEARLRLQLLILNLILAFNFVNLNAIEITTQKYSSYAHFLQGLAYLKQNELQKATYEFEKTIELDPNAVGAYKELISVYLQSGKLEKAKQKAEKLKQLSDDTDTKLFLGSFYVVLADTQSAINQYEEVIRKEPTNLEAIIVLAGIYSVIAPEKALNYWEEYISLNPESDEAYYRKALILKKLNRIEEAKEALKEALNKKPDDLLLNLTLSEIYEIQQDTIAATNQLEKFITAKEAVKGRVAENFGIYIRIGNLYFQAKQYPKAEEFFTKASTLLPDDPTAYFWLAVLSEEKKDYTSAIKYLEKILKCKDITDTATYIRLSYYYSQLKNTKKSIQLLKKSLKSSPNSPEIHFFLGLGYIDLKKYKKAEKHLLKTIQLKDDFSDAYFYLGVIYEQTGRFENSIKYFRKVIELDEKNSAALNYLGYSFADRNINLDEAEMLIKKALELEPENGAYIDSLGWVYFRQGKYAEAKALLEKAVLKLEDPVIYEHLGDVEKVLCDTDKEKAMEYYRKALKLDPKNKKLRKKLRK
ncbi:MAG: tetratricopeptide repeat protein [Elusimicrobiota bacterium]|nr:tetratricopeptide repeat protein [Elusimicrobiota bacterium]